MQNSEHKIDELFRSKLSGFEVTPPPEVWERIAGDLGYAKKRRRALLIWSFSGAASLLLAFLMGWYLAGTGNRASLNELSAKLDSHRSEQVQPVISEPVVHEQLAVHFDEPQFKAIRQNLPLHRTLPAREEHTAGEVLARLNSKSTTLRIPGIPSQQLVPDNDEFFTEADKAILEANLLAMNESSDEQAKGNWALGVNASPVYRFDQPSFGKDQLLMDYNAGQSQLPSSYQTNVAGGVSFAYETSGRFEFISGISYSEVAQNTGDVALSFNSHNWLNEGGDLSYDYPNNSGFEGVGVLQDNSANNIILNTEVGIANIDLPEGASLASAKVLNSIVPEATQNYDYKQQARYVEVPLLMRYRIIDKKLGLNVLGGINTNVLVSNTVRLEAQNTVVASGKIEGLRPLTWSSSVGMGVNYELTNHLNLNFEPTLKIQLNSLNTQSYFNARPYTFGVFSGVSYKF